MTYSRSLFTWALLLAALILATVPSNRARAADWVLPPGQESQLLALLSVPGWGEPDAAVRGGRVRLLWHKGAALDRDLAAELRHPATPSAVGHARIAGRLDVAVDAATPWPPAAVAALQKQLDATDVTLRWTLIEPAVLPSAVTAVDAAAQRHGPRLAERAAREPDVAAAEASAAVTQADAAAACEYSAVASALVDRPQLARPLLDAILAKSPTCKPAYLAAPRVHGDEASLPRLIAVLEQGVRSRPGDLDLRYLMGDALHAAWRNPEAAVQYEAVAQANIQYPFVLGRLATCYTQDPRVTESGYEQPFLDRLAKDPKDIPARYVAGCIAYYQDRFDDVLTLLEPLLKEVPGEPRVYLYTAMAHFRLGHQRRAEENLDLLSRRVKHDDPDEFYVRSIVGRAKDFEQSLRDLETFVERSKGRRDHPNKVAKIQRELAIMRSGRAPTWFDLQPAGLRWSAWGGGGLLITALAVWLVRRALRNR
jgi:tetratricopeptide (TPR) repeat protein